MLPKRYNTVAPTRDLVRSNSEEPTETTSILPNNDHEHDFQSYALHRLHVENAEIQKIEVEHVPIKPLAVSSQKVEIHGQRSSTYWCHSATSGLQCSTQLLAAGTCDYLTNKYWRTGNNTCMSQSPMNSTCTFDHQCLTNISLSCSSPTNLSSCQCADNYWYNTTKCARKFLSGGTYYTDYWAGFLNSTYGAYCTPKINYGVTSFTCVSSYQCRNYNCVKCVSGQCTCNSTYEYWDGTMYIHVMQHQICRNWASVPNLQCFTPTSGGTTNQCLSNSTQDFDYCRDSCYTAHGWQAACTYLASCTTGQDYQCEEYNLLSCIASQCNCASVMYWPSSLNYCVAKSSYLRTCVHQQVNVLQQLVLV
ncbi:unnamed protein product [Rotaria socialis]|uniref:Uncharacterized protein n=1 Tax=Rotaria socialis TaxID=392032 RepID=A0A818B1E5_9BILA|nr:unnamed protein product [Rotaria socialis]